MSQQNRMIKTWDGKHFKAVMEFKNCDSNAKRKVKASEAATGGVL